MAEPSVSAAYARGLLDLAIAKGAARATLLERSGIDPADLHDPDNRIRFEDYVALMRAAKELSGDPALALHYGEAVDISQISIVGLIGQASETMIEAFVQLNRYVRLVVDVDEGTVDRFRITRERAGLWFVDTRASPNSFPELTESAFSQLICAPRKFGVAQWVKAVQVTHPKPAHHAEYDRIFQAPTAFESERNAMRIDESSLTHRLAILPRYAFGVLSEHADALLNRLESAKSARGRVESLLMPILHKGDASMDAVASQMGLSRQTLYRRLKAEGATFEQVLDELRRQMALNYLNGGKASVNQTAYLVGFSEPAAFSRAFKRWTGKSPREARAVRG